MSSSAIILDPTRIHDFGCSDEKRKRLAEHHESTQVTVARGPSQHAWSPYVDNGGTALGIAGKGYALIAADTRMSLGYGILSRDSSKLGVLTEKCIISTCGMQADRASFFKNINVRLQNYEFANQGRLPGPQSIAQLVSTMLYNRRFFPYYCFTCVAGVDNEGNGVVFGYDAVGCIESLSHCVEGTGRDMIEPLLDAKINRQHYPNQKKGEKYRMTKEEAIELALTAFKAAAERDIYTGDQVEIMIVSDNEPIRKITHQLRKD